MRAYKCGGGERVLATCHCEPRWVLDADYGCCWQATCDRFDGTHFSLRCTLNGLTVVRPPPPSHASRAWYGVIAGGRGAGPVGRRGGFPFFCRASCPRTLIGGRVLGDLRRIELTAAATDLDFRWNRSSIKNRLLETNHRLWKKFEFNISSSNEGQWPRSQRLNIDTNPQCLNEDLDTISLNKEQTISNRVPGSNT